MDHRHQHPIRAGNAGERHRRHGFFRACWYRRTIRARGLAPDNASCCTSAPSITARTVWVNGQLAGRARGRIHAVHVRHHRPRSDEGRATTIVVRAEDDPPTSRSRAASRTGSSSRTRSGIRGRPASGRRSGSKRCRRPGSTGCAGRPTSSAGRSASRRWVHGARRERTAARRQAHVRRRCCSPTTPMRSSPARCTGASRCPIRASTTTATSCSGARQSPTLIDAEIELWGDRGELLDRGRAATPRCDRSPCRATASC